MSNGEESVRAAIGRAVAGFMQVHQSGAAETLAALIAVFEKYSTGLALTKATSWQPRQAVLMAMESAAGRGVRRLCPSLLACLLAPSSLVLGTWYLVLGTWYLVLGTWYLVLDT